MEIIICIRIWHSYMKCDLRPNDIFCNQLLLRHSCRITLYFIEHMVRCSSFLLTAFSHPMRNIDEIQIKNSSLWFICSAWISMWNRVFFSISKPFYLKCNIYPPFHLLLAYFYFLRFLILLLLRESNCMHI